MNCLDIIVKIVNELELDNNGRIIKLEKHIRNLLYSPIVNIGEVNVNIDPVIESWIVISIGNEKSPLFIVGDKKIKVELTIEEIDYKNLHDICNVIGMVLSSEVVGEINYRTFVIPPIKERVYNKVIKCIEEYCKE